MYIHRNQEQSCNECVLTQNFSIVGHNATVVHQVSTKARPPCRCIYSLINGYLFVGTIVPSTVPIGFSEVWLIRIFELGLKSPITALANHVPVGPMPTPLLFCGELPQTSLM
jgi:hypothetical protein